jgi:hypothetical protein
MKSEQEVRFFAADEDNDFPTEQLEKRINSWIKKESKTTWKVKVDAISHNVDIVEGHYSAMLLYHYSNEGD